MGSVVGSFTPEELSAMREYYNSSKDPNNRMKLEMKSLPEHFVLGENFSFDEYTKLVSESRSSIYWFTPKIGGIVITLYAIIIFFGLITNSVVCFIICYNKKLQTTTNLLITNLAVSDIIMCLFCTPFTVVKILMKNWALGEVMCKVVPWFQGMVVFSSTLTITAIALDRYYLIVVSTKGNSFDHKKMATALVVMVIWIVSAIICLPLLVNSKLEVKEYIHFVSYTMCLESWPPTQSRFVYASVIMLFQFVIPIAVLLIIHWKICNFLKFRIIRDPKSPLEMNRAMKDAKRHRKNTTLLMAIAIMFALCWFPLTLLNLLADFNYKIFMFENFILSYTVAHIIAMLSACLNPIMYGWFNTNFRKEYAKVFCFWNKSESDKAVEELEEQIIVYKRQVSYKAIQTEVQPAIRRISRPQSSPSDKDTENVNWHSSVTCSRKSSSDSDSIDEYFRYINK